MSTNYLVRGEFYRNGWRLLELNEKVPLSKSPWKVLIDGREYSYIRNSMESWLIVKGVEFSCIGKTIQVL